MRYIPFAALSLASVVVFLVAPEIDIVVQRWFHQPGNGFFLRDSVFAVSVSETIIIATPVAIGLMVLAVAATFAPRFGGGYARRLEDVLKMAEGIEDRGQRIAALFRIATAQAKAGFFKEALGTARSIEDEEWRDSAFRGIAADRARVGFLWRSIVLFLACLVIGSGVIVNGALKENWGRARPYHVSEFGGTKKFTPPLSLAAECDRNCSFVAGHPSAVFALFGPALLLGRFRLVAILAVTLAGGLTGLARMMQGAHFLSDVLFCGILMYVIAWALYKVVSSVAPQFRDVTASENR